MATPITHIVLAREFHHRHPEVGPERDFVVGVLFPDIRHVANIPRELTHDPEPSLDKVLNAADAFQAGLEHHALVDVTRHRFVVSHDGYAQVPDNPYLTVSFKLLEDELMYGRESDWPAVIGLFNEVLDQERVHGLKDADVVRWHDLITEYVREAPTPETRRRFITKGGWSPEIADQIEAGITELKRNETVGRIIADLYRDFESLLR